MKKITPEQLICMNEYEGDYPLRIDLAYADEANLLFGEKIYHEKARLWLFVDLAEIVLEAATRVHEAHGYSLVLYDGLRTTEAQARMLETCRVKDNPQWLEEPRLLSPPGAGGHPRAMAVDVSLQDEDGQLLDMGTVFDFLVEDQSAAHNPAHREYKNLTEEAAQNRNILNNAMFGAAERLLNKGKITMPLEGLLQEWWDFRAPREFYEQFPPLSDEDLPGKMRMVSTFIDPLIALPKGG